MPMDWRTFRPALLAVLVLMLALPLAPTSVLAQDGTNQGQVVIQGTPELENFVGALRDAYASAHPDAQVEIDPRGGLRGGFDALCQGTVDIVMSTEPISDAQIRACNNAGQGFVEAVLAHEAVALLATPEAQVTCLDRTQVEALWQLGADPNMTWADLGSEVLSEPVTVVGPDSIAPAYLLFRNLVPAGELRDDVQVVDSTDQLMAQVTGEGSTDVGFLSLAELQQLNAEGQVTPLALRNDAGECIAPDETTVATGQYPLARTDYLYVNAASAQRQDVQDFLQYALLDPAGASATAAAQGFTPANAETYQTSVDNILQGRVGRTFTRPLTPVNVPVDTAGDVQVVGSSLLGDLTRQVRRDFTTTYVSANVVLDTFGNDAGWQAFCSGDAAVLEATRPATDEEQALCEQNGIESYTVDLGTQALVLAVPGGSSVECATPQEIGTLLRAGTDETPVATWDVANPEWPAADVLLVVSPWRTGQTDYLIADFIGDLTLNLRSDGLEKSDPLYRLQGVANTDNGLTWAWWTEAQPSEANVKLLALDDGSGCVAPSAETIADGTYPLSFPVRYYFSQAALDQPLVRAFLWQFFADTTLTTLENTPYVGLDLQALRTTQRDQLFQMLSDIEAAQPAQAQPSETPTPEGEATAEPTAEVTAEATAEPTVEATEAATEEATTAPEEATPAATETSTGQ